LSWQSPPRSSGVARQVHLHSTVMSRGQAYEWISQGQKTIETKTRTSDARHLHHARQTAVWLRRYRRRWCRRGALPVLCVAHARRLEHVEDEVLVVSLDRLEPALRAGAGTSPRPRFLAPQTYSR
jgi:hypothetical protein